jgi:two-component system, OmpR family, sensor histidine kinase MtrB
LPRTADEPLRGSPIPLEPKDSRRNRGLDDAGLPRGGGDKAATVPAQPTGDQVTSRDPIAPRSATVAPTADPTALPGNGARVVPRPSSSAPRPDSSSGGHTPGGGTAGRPDAGSQESYEQQGEAFRGR